MFRARLTIPAGLLAAALVMLGGGAALAKTSVVKAAGARVPVVELHSPAAAPAVSAAPADRAVLKYEAYVAGINAGEARLTLDRTEVQKDKYRYRVAGSARSKGLWESMQQWRAQYSVDGAVTETQLARQVAPGHFFSLQTTPKKRREIHIENGILKETKNHKVRDPRPAQRGFDLLSALFFLPPCHPEVRVHTGRDGYDMRRLQPKASRGPAESGVAATLAQKPQVLSCRYAVADDEGGSYEMALEYERRGGFIVPSQIHVQGPLSGRMILSEG